jgi:hypothetical protein
MSLTNPWRAWALVIGALMFALVRALKANQIGDLQSRLSLRDDEITDYRRKLEGASPDEARDRIEKLEAEIAALRPRSIGQAQNEAMRGAIAGVVGNLAIETDAACGDGRKFAGGIGAAFEAAGWAVRLPMVLGMAQSGPSGLRLLVQEQNQMTDVEDAARRALIAANLDFDVVSHPHPGMIEGPHIQVSAPH